MALVRIRTAPVVLVHEADVVQTKGGSSRKELAAAASGTDKPDFLVVIVAFVGVLAIWAVCFLWNWIGPKPAAPAVLAAGVGVFALLYIAAQALERLLEPLVSLDFKKAQKEEARNDRLAAALNDPDPGKTTAVAVAQAALERWRNNRTVVIWALATVIGMWASALSGMYLLDITIESPTPPQAFDILITGLVVGGGTKPLHDLIARLEKSNTQAEDPPEVRSG
jgi:hypothetical protein